MENNEEVVVEQRQARADAMTEFGLVDKKSGKNAAAYAEIDQLKAQVAQLQAELTARVEQCQSLEAQVAQLTQTPDVPEIPPFAPKANPFA